jgi:hypothetical protein
LSNGTNFATTHPCEEKKTGVKMGKDFATPEVT